MLVMDLNRGGIPYALHVHDAVVDFSGAEWFQVHVYVHGDFMTSLWLTRKTHLVADCWDTVEDMLDEWLEAHNG